MLLLNTKEHLNKFDSKAQKHIMSGYSEWSKGYRVYNTETKIVEKSIHVRFDDKLDLEQSKLVDQFTDLEITYTRAEDNDSEKIDSESPQRISDKIN
jgi:hypothetical protein